MFYALGSVGAFSQGARKRRKEIRSERAAIREEFDRWRKNNPYATAAEFHSKVKQLGSSTPGGGVALPDHQAIQQMAAQNQMQKQMVEQERERTRAVQDLNMTRAMSQGFSEYFANNPSANVSDAVNSMKLPLDLTTQALAENAQRGAQNKLALTKQATETTRLERERAEIFAYMRQMTNPYYASYSPAQKLEEAARTLGYTLPSDLQKVVDKDVSTQANDQTAAAPSSPAQTSTMLPQPDTMGAVPPASCPTSYGGTNHSTTNQCGASVGQRPRCGTVRDDPTRRRAANLKRAGSRNRQSSERPNRRNAQARGRGGSRKPEQVYQAA